MPHLTCSRRWSSQGLKTESEAATHQANDDARGVLTGAAQEEVLESVEKHFVAGLRRADGRTVGLGL